MGDQSAIEYRNIPDFEGYRVGSDGSVWSRWAHNGHQPRRLGANWRPLKPQPDGDGYLALNLFRAGRARRRKVHLLVLRVFIGPRPDGMEGCHNNGDLTDCSLDNLRWDMPAANQRDRLTHGTDSRGTRNGNARLTEEAVLAIRAALATGRTKKSLAKAHGVAPSTISAIASRRLWAWA